MFWITIVFMVAMICVMVLAIIPAIYDDYKYLRETLKKEEDKRNYDE